MIKIENGVAVREPVPDFLFGLAPESLADLTWTDPALGVRDAVWWPEEYAPDELGTGMRWGAETFILDESRKVVVVTRAQEPLSDEESSALFAAHVAQTTAAFEQAIQNKLNSTAIAARYDSIQTAVSYAEEPAVPRFQRDGIDFRAWRSLVWAYAYEQMDMVLAGEREQPTLEQFLAELTVLELPT